MTNEDFDKVFPALDAAKINSAYKVFWLACGTEDSLMGVNRQFRSWLDSKGVRHTTTEIPAFAHVWPLWRRNLAEFAPQLFQASQTAPSMSQGGAGGGVPQAAGGRGGRGPQQPQFQSVEVMADRRVAFKVYAPNAQAVRLSGSDIPGNGRIINSHDRSSCCVNS